MVIEVGTVGLLSSTEHALSKINSVNMIRHFMISFEVGSIKI